MSWIRKRRPSPATGIALAALVVALGGVAFAAIPDSNGTIHGCYQRTNGVLRVVESAGDCRGRERALDWNQQGPPGPPGGNVVARPRGGPFAVTEPGTTQIPLSPSSWTQGPNEFQGLHIGIRISNVVCGDLRVSVRLDGVRLQTWVSTPTDDGRGTWVEPIFEPAATTTHTLTAEATPTGCGDTRRGGTVESVKADVIGFS
jgi:hypothetical protein